MRRDAEPSFCHLVTLSPCHLVTLSPCYVESRPPIDNEIIYASATALAQAIRTRSHSSEEVVAAYLRRIAIINPQLNAVVQLTADTALARGEISGPLHGVPMTMIAPVPLGDPSAIALKQLRVAVYTDNGIMPPTAETVVIVRAAADALATAGLSIVEARPPGVEQTDELVSGLFNADSSTIRMLLELYGTTEVHPWLKPAPTAAAASPALAAAMADWLFRWGIFRNQMLAFMEAYDVILCPVCAFPAIPHGTSDDPDNLHGFSYTKTYNLTGWPGVVVRCGTSAAGMPIGVQVVARPWREDVALAVAAYLEQVFGGWQPSDKVTR